MPNATQKPARDNLLYASPEHTVAKIDTFIQAGAGQLQLVFDFDRTLTISKPGNNEDITTWHILNEHLPQPGKDRYRKLFKQYRAREISGALTQTDATTWWSSILNLFVEHQIDMTNVEKDFLSKASIRPGTKELFDTCATHGIPTIILSAGIKDVIELWAQTYQIHPTIILSTSLQLDKNGKTSGWDKESLVHVLNKKEIGHPELQKIRTERSKTILIGDSLNDADMAEGTESVFRILINDPRDDENKNNTALHAKAFQTFDAIIETGNLYPVQQLIKQIIKNP